jgi:hypothetical protein
VLRVFLSACVLILSFLVFAVYSCFRTVIALYILTSVRASESRQWRLHKVSAYWLLVHRHQVWPDLTSSIPPADRLHSFILHSLIQSLLFHTSFLQHLFAAFLRYIQFYTNQHRNSASWPNTQWSIQSFSSGAASYRLLMSKTNVMTVVCSCLIFTVYLSSFSCDSLWVSIKCWMMSFTVISLGISPLLLACLGLLFVWRSSLLLLGIYLLPRFESLSFSYRQRLSSRRDFCRCRVAMVGESAVTSWRTTFCSTLSTFSFFLFCMLPVSDRLVFNLRPTL